MSDILCIYYSRTGNTRRAVKAIAADLGAEIVAIRDGEELAYTRGAVLYGLDEIADLRYSHENPSVQALYREYLGAPLSEPAETLLHTEHSGWFMPGHPDYEKR